MHGRCVECVPVAVGRYGERRWAACGRRATVADRAPLSGADRAAAGLSRTGRSTVEVDLSGLVEGVVDEFVVRARGLVTAHGSAVLASVSARV